MVVQAFAERLRDDREVREAPRHLKKVASAQPLQPERRPFAGMAARQQQGAGGVLTKTQRKEGAVAQLAQDQALDVFRRQTLEQIDDRLVGVGEADEQALVMVQA